MNPAPTIRVGTDVCSILEVAQAVEEFGERYLRRVYTDHELSYCIQEPSRCAEHLAVRFAAKEAAVKVLRPDGFWPNWRTIEVRRHDGGWCDLALSGTAQRLAEAAGIAAWAVSLSHEGDTAVAVVLATLSTPPEPDHLTAR